MTPELDQLARRAVACSGWRWMPGMLTMTGRRIIASDDRSYIATSATLPAKWDEPELPDFTDPATVGCLIALVREAWRDPEAHLALGVGGWVLMSGESRIADVVYPSPAGKTEAEAIVYALEAGP